MMSRKSTRLLVLDAAARVLSQNQGASLSEVADVASVGRATVYRYFPTRENLMRELCIQALDETDEASAASQDIEDPIEYLRAIADALVPLGDKYHFLMSSHESSMNDPVIRRRYLRQLDQVKDMVEWLKEEGHMAVDIPTPWAVACIDNLIYSAWQTVRDGSVARKQAADLLVRTFLTGMGPDTRAKSKTGRKKSRMSS
jgi:AcrR family transcriptional regulator